MRARLGVDYDLVSIPRRYFDLGRRRTKKMMNYQIARMSFADVLANAYLQGIEDGYFVAEHKLEESDPASGAA